MKKLFRFFGLLVCLCLVACSRERRPPSKLPYSFTDWVPKVDTRVRFLGVPFIDKRGTRRVSEIDAFSSDIQGTAVKIRLRGQGEIGELGNSAEWRVPGIVRAASRFSLKGEFGFEQAPECGDWLVGVEINIGGRRQAVGWTREGVRTFANGSSIEFAKDASTPRRRFELVGDKTTFSIYLEGKRSFVSTAAGLASDNSGDLSVLTYLAPAPADCTGPELALRFETLRLDAE